jgi:saccharopine dehydrogenase-like NADP-dependent oxidoreductase
MKIVVLGAGMVGKAIAIDLSARHQVTAVDLDNKSLDYLSTNYDIEAQLANLSEKKVIETLIDPFDLVVSAVPGFMGFETLRRVIESGKDVVDISFMPEDFLELDGLAKSKGVTAIADCGVAPGIPNLVMGRYNEEMAIEDFEYFVGGLPFEKNYPFYYKAPFSPIDVIEEYTRPARLVVNGKVVEKPAMSDIEMLTFDGIGSLEGFLTDGLRSLLKTMAHVPNMREKTLRYPGHVQLLQALRAVGFFDSEPIEVKGARVSPLDFTSRILTKNWKLEANEREFTVMRIILKGKQEEVNKEIVYELFDKYDPVAKLSSMARTTGFTATACAELILNQGFNTKGVLPLESIGKHQVYFQFVMEYLAQRNINYKKLEKIF